MSECSLIRYVVHTSAIFLDVQDNISCDPETLWSRAFLCPTCGVVWARIYGTKAWIAKTALCPTHGGGSLIDWSLSDYYILDHPIELLRYEVLIWKPPSSLPGPPNPSSEAARPS